MLNSEFLKKYAQLSPAQRDFGRRLQLLALVLALLFSVSGCDGGDASMAPTPAAAPTDVQASDTVSESTEATDAAGAPQADSDMASTQTDIASELQDSASGEGPDQGNSDAGGSATDAGSDLGPEPGLEPSSAVILEMMTAARLPGFASCVVKDGAIAWCGGYGMADIQAGRQVTPETPFMLASVSKLITATAVMQAWEEGLIDLDADVDAMTTFPVKHPTFPDTPITARQLLAHVGGLDDNWSALGDWYVEDSDPVLSLEEILTGYLSPDGQWYDAEANFMDGAPGTVAEYSNVGYALLGHLVAVHREQDFALSSQATVLEPLGMNNSGWRFADFEPGETAMPYKWDGSSFQAIGRYTFSDYPDGGLFSSARDMARFMVAFVSEGILDDTRILSADSVSAMWQVPFMDVDANRAHGWQYFDQRGERWIGHSGSEQGVATDLMIRLSDRSGFVFLMNGNWSGDGATAALENFIIDFAEDL